MSVLPLTIEYPGHAVINVFHAKLTEHKISTAHKNKTAEKKMIFFVFKLSYVLFIILINVKMSTIVGIITFMSKLYYAQLS